MGGSLKSLELDEVLNVTNTGLKLFFDTEDSESLGLLGVARLKRIVLSNMHLGVVDDEVLRLICVASDKQLEGDGLEHGDFTGGGKTVTDKGLEYIAKHCKKR